MSPPGLPPDVPEMVSLQPATSSPSGWGLLRPLAWQTALICLVYCFPMHLIWAVPLPVRCPPSLLPSFPAALRLSSGCSRQPCSPRSSLPTLLLSEAVLPVLPGLPLIGPPCLPPG